MIERAGLTSVNSHCSLATDHSSIFADLRNSYPTQKQARVELGVFAFDIFAEAFVSPAQIPPQLTAQEVRIAGSNISFVWKPDAGSIWMRRTLPASSYLVVAGSASAKAAPLTVISGEVAHLSAVDVEPGHCLACVAVPLSGVTLARG